MHNGMIQIDPPLKATVWSAGQYVLFRAGWYLAILRGPESGYTASGIGRRDGP